MTLFLLTMHTALALMAMFMPSPLTIGALLFLQAVIAACIICTTLSTWISLVVLIIFLGGLMVMFAYFTALTPNPVLPSSGDAIIALKIATMLVAIMCIPSLPSAYIPSDPDILPDNSQMIAPTEIYADPNLAALILITSLLLLALIMVVKIMSQSSGPLRPFK